MFASATNGIRLWLISVFASAINRSSRAEDRQAAIQWLLRSRDILAGRLGATTTFKRLYAELSARAALKAIAASIADTVRNYKNSSLPWPMKIAMPATLAAIPLVGGHGAGVAAFGSAIGLPVLLLIFLGTAGITSIIEMAVTQPLSRLQIAEVVERILTDEAVRRASAKFKAAMRDAATAPRATPMPDDDTSLREKLLAMDPYDFEAHIMSFFEKAGLFAVVTPRSNDFGLDGYAAHPQGLIIVQCKRYATLNKVGRPSLNAFKAVIGDEGAWKGYIVTTSSFTIDAKLYAVSAPAMILVDMEDLVRWHRQSPTF